MNTTLAPVNAPSLTNLNTMPVAEFVALLGGIFEHSPWVAEGVAADRPFTSVDALHTAMVSVVEQAGPDRRLALLNAHPELAGREAQRGELTASSTVEQARAGLHALSAEEARRISDLNAAYRSRFGFPFIVAVRDHTKAGIFEAFARRLANPPDAEFSEALRQVYRISRLRLDATLTV
jgi:2-oxo-4-hydroxy-4-carboxy-5-ureidoimidazoline decarboxylase